jgi:glutaryl-CoA dehydrogenase
VARGEVLAAFALAEPDHGSDSVSLDRGATRAGEWVLNGAKKWIGNGSSGGITYVWRGSGDDGRGTVRCFLVPQDTPATTDARSRQGVAARHPSGAHHAHRRGSPADAVPGAKTFKDASTVLYATRSGVAWSALGHATACYESAPPTPPRVFSSASRSPVSRWCGAPHADAR